MSCEPRTAHSVVEASLYLMVTPCAACRHGALEAALPTAGNHPQGVRFETTCLNCGITAAMEFLLPEASETAALRSGPGSVDPLAGNAPISTTEAPSTLVDAVQWATLAQVQLEAAESTPSPAEQRWRRIRAAQCLDEALKFYDDDNELPPAGALLTDSSRTALRDYPQRFARTRLVAMRAALPADGLVGRVLANAAEASRRKPWWRFW